MRIAETDFFGEQMLTYLWAHRPSMFNYAHLPDIISMTDLFRYDGTIHTPHWPKGPNYYVTLHDRNPTKKWE